MMLEAINVGRQFDNRWVFRDLSLTVTSGDCFALLGATGSGKSLLLRSLARLESFDEGTLHWQQAEIGSDDVPRFRSKVCYLHQRPYFLEGTVEQNLRQPWKLQIHQGGTFNPERIRKWLLEVGRDESFLKKDQSELSGGEAQLAALLRVMQLSPNFLLLDEPTAALDSTSTELVETLLANWLQDNPADRATMWVTHDPDQAKRVSQKVLNLEHGQLHEVQRGWIR